MAEDDIPEGPENDDPNAPQAPKAPRSDGSEASDAPEEHLGAPEEAARAEQDPASAAAGQLPSNFFRAAGDPDEPPPEPDNSFSGRLAARWAAFKAAAGPKLKDAGVRAQLFGAEVGSRLGRVRTPRTLRESAIWAGWTLSGIAAIVAAFFFYVTWDMPSTDDLWDAKQGQSITFLDRNGHVILREGAQNAPPVDLSTLPPYVPQAFIAIEDRRFYQHFGVDLGGLMRAGTQNMRAGHVVQGGSTITQQLAKNLFLSNERTWRRKAQEVALALWLESKFTKDEILALYLSRVYFGAGAYGIEAASERYFDRPARELTLLQSAMLAGLVKEPSRLNPALQDVDRAHARAQVVLGEMVGQGFISDSERRAALQEELVISRKNPAGVLSYFRDWIDPQLSQIVGTQRDDFIVDTTIDILSQRAGVEAVDAVLDADGVTRHVGQGALVAMDDTGGVRTLVGGRDYATSEFDRVTQAHRQPGSSFKFFVYLAAMEQGLTPWSVREDAPITIGDWSPGNYTEQYHGPTQLSTAFADSFNMVAIRVANEIGGQHVIDVAERLGIRSPLHDYRSLALGAQEVTLLEMTQAYGAMASEGYRIEPHGITRIRRANNNEVMWSWRPPPHVRIIQDRPMRLMNYMMNRVVQAGTGTAAQIEGRELAGKTGTGNDYRDAWFIGFTPGMVAGVWVGNDNFAAMQKVTGGSLPTEIWRRYMTVALHSTPARPLQMPTPDDMQAMPSGPEAEARTVSAAGAPIGAVIDHPPPQPPDHEDRSLDFGPAG